MPTAIPEQLVDQARTLLAHGKPQREVARKTGISRGTISKIAKGTYRVKPRPPRVEEMFGKEKGRCLGCGGMVRLPCLACRIEAKREAELARRKAEREAS